MLEVYWMFWWPSYLEHCSFTALVACRSVACACNHCHSGERLFRSFLHDRLPLHNWALPHSRQVSCCCTMQLDFITVLITGHMSMMAFYQTEQVRRSYLFHSLFLYIFAFYKKKTQMRILAFYKDNNFSSTDYEGIIYLICPYNLPWVSPDKMVWATRASWVVWEGQCLLSSCCWMRSGLRSLRSSSAPWPSYQAWCLCFFQRHGMWGCQRQLMTLKSQGK